MAKVFRLTDNGSSVEHWAESTFINSDYINSISTSDGGLTRKEPTSIPSPFARLDLVNTAFSEVVRNKDLDGKTVNHKIVSDVLDLLEITFNYNLLKDDLKIIYWDKKSNLDQLLNSSNEKHRLYGKTLELFLNQDKESFNFDDLNGIYIFKYKHRVIGGTSPLTLFFSSANDLSFANISLTNGDIFFDEDYCPLYKREDDFIKYVFSLFKGHPELNLKMRNFAAYLAVNLNRLNSSNHELYDEINNYTKDYNFLESCRTLDTGIAGQNIEIFNIPLYKKSGDLKIEDESEFVISSSKFKSLYPDKQLPLVLQNKFTKPLKYTNSKTKWDSNVEVPYFDKNSNLEDRELPTTKVKYPYLTVSDFLEPTIFELDYPLNNSAYFNGNIKNEVETNGFTLPLTKLFFEFFTVDDLLNLKVSGEHMLSMKARNVGDENNKLIAEAIDVTLRIPINNNKDVITFFRTYRRKSILNGDTSDLVNNKGIIEKLDASLAIFPFVKSNYVNEYRVGLYNVSSYKIDLNYINESNLPNQVIANKIRTNSQILKTSYDLVDSPFEYISISQLESSNIIIPMWKNQNVNQEAFTFAIDFGTTNTHIEYQIGNTEPKPFEINENDIQYHSTIDRKVLTAGRVGAPLRMLKATELELTPTIINKDSDYNFPIRTAVSFKPDIDKKVPVYALMDYSIPFAYQIKSLPTDNFKILTNLKWKRNDFEGEKDVRKYLEELILLIKNKIVLNNGDINKTKIKWSYPLSMSPNQLNTLESIFEELVIENLGKNVDVNRFSESIVPYQTLNKQYGVTALNTPVACIDIGGGTVDMVVYFKDKPQVITSFKLGVNSIFANGYNKPKLNNGFKKIYEHIQEVLVHNGLEIKNQGEELLNNSENYVDYSIFAFSLKSNKDLLNKKLDISFSNMLSRNGDHILVFLLYYSSIIYHLAKIMKLNELVMPNAVTFSGNGSKILDVIDSNPRARILNEITNLIFSKVYKEESDEIQIRRFDNPKEMTAKGMIYTEESENPKKYMYTLLGDIDNTTDAVYNEIEQYVNGIEEEFNSFIDLFFDLNKDFNFTDNFDITPTKLNQYKSFIKSQTKDELLLGIKDRSEQLNNDLNVSVNESLFFYPLYGILSSLNTYINEN